MPITDPSAVATTTVHGTHLTIGASIEGVLQGLNANSEVIDISVVRRAVGNNYTAFITYEEAPAAP